MPAVRRTPRRWPAAIALIGLCFLCAGVLAGVAGGQRAPAPAATRTADVPPLVARARSKIKHVVFVLLENRSFDEVFGRYPGADGATAANIAGGKTAPLLHSPLYSWHDVDHD